MHIFNSMAHKKLVMTFVVIQSLVWSTYCCGKLSMPAIRATNSKIGIEISSDGHVNEMQVSIPSTTETIYLEFYLDAPDSSRISLDIKWYFEGRVFNAYNTVQPKGYVIANITREPTASPEFPPGNYVVEVWFLNTQILSVPFKVVGVSKP